MPYPSSSVHHTGSYYLCPRQMSAEDQIYPVPGFNPTTQKQVLRCVWRPQLRTFKYVLDTIPRTVPDRPKLPRRMRYCLQEIVDVDGHLLYFTSKVDIMCHIDHHQTSHRSSPMFIQSNNHSLGILISVLGGRNFGSSSWSEAVSKWAASKFPSLPIYQSAPVQSPSSSFHFYWKEINPRADRFYRMSDRAFNQVLLHEINKCTWDPSLKVVTLPRAQTEMAAIVDFKQ